MSRAVAYKLQKQMAEASGLEPIGDREPCRLKITWYENSLLYLNMEPSRFYHSKDWNGEEKRFKK